jgi:hypothetical protein
MKRSESEANIYFRGMSELNARMEASVVFLKCVCSTLRTENKLLERIPKERKDAGDRRLGTVIKKANLQLQAQRQVFMNELKEREDAMNRRMRDVIMKANLQLREQQRRNDIWNAEQRGIIQRLQQVIAAVIFCTVDEGGRRAGWCEEDGGRRKDEEEGGRCTCY